MKILPTIGAKLSSYKSNKLAKYLDKYCAVSADIDKPILKELSGARKGIADFAKSKGVRVEISDAEKKMANQFFEFDIDERHVKKAAVGNLDITVTQLKPQRKGGFQVVEALSAFVSKDTKKITNHTVPDYIVIDYPQDGIQRTRLTSHQYEDTFLKTIYRKVAQMANALQVKKK